MGLNTKWDFFEDTPEQQSDFLNRLEWNKLEQIFSEYKRSCWVKNTQFIPPEKISVKSVALQVEDILNGTMIPSSTAHFSTGSIELLILAHEWEKQIFIQLFHELTHINAGNKDEHMIGEYHVNQTGYSRIMKISSEKFVFFEGFNEWVTQKIAEEITSQYFNDPEWKKRIPPLRDKKGRPYCIDIYLEEQWIVNNIIERIAILQQCSINEAWNKIKRWYFEGWFLLDYLQHLGLSKKEISPLSWDNLDFLFEM